MFLKDILQFMDFNSFAELHFLIFDLMKLSKLFLKIIIIIVKMVLSIIKYSVLRKSAAKNSTSVPVSSFDDIPIIKNIMINFLRCEIKLRLKIKINKSYVLITIINTGTYANQEKNMVAEFELRQVPYFHFCRNILWKNMNLSLLLTTMG